MLNEGFSPIIFASENGQLKVVQELIRNNADLKEATIGGNTALIWAVKKGHEKIVTGNLEFQISILVFSSIFKKQFDLDLDTMLSEV